MNRGFAVPVVVALFAVAGCTTGQPSGGGADSPTLASPTLVAPSMATIPASTPTTSPPSPAASAGVSTVPDGPLAAGRYRLAQWDTGCSERQRGCSRSPEHDAARVMVTVPRRLGWDPRHGLAGRKGERST